MENKVVQIEGTAYPVEGVVPKPRKVKVKAPEAKPELEWLEDIFKRIAPNMPTKRKEQLVDAIVEYLKQTK